MVVIFICGQVSVDGGVAVVGVGAVGGAGSAAGGAGRGGCARARRLAPLRRGLARVSVRFGRIVTI